MQSVRLFQAKMQKREERKTEEQKRNDQIRETTQKVERFFSRNRGEITKETLATLLPQLETQLDPTSHSQDQYDSLIAFLRLCRRYNDLLPECLNQFKDPEVLFDRFSSLKNSEWFRNTPSIVKNFINLQLEKNKPQLTNEKHNEEAKELQLIEKFSQKLK